MNQIKKTVSILLSVIMVFSLFTVIPFTASAATSIRYIDENGDSQTANGVTELTSGTTTLTADRYAVTADTEIGSRITCQGDVELILCDGATLTAAKGISVNENNSLTIYGQSSGTGALVISHLNGNEAGIGGDNNKNSGQITICGGTVTAYSEFAAAIGGGYLANGTVTITGGTVTATGITSAGIGGGYQGEGKVTVSGGVIDATSTSGAGIGGGFESKGEVTVSGGTITAHSENAAGIGGGNYSSGSVTITGGAVSATSAYGVGVGGYDGTGSTVKLGWSGSGDSIYASSYNAEMTLLNAFINGTETLQAGTVSDLSLINEKTLSPVTTDYIDADGSAKAAVAKDLTSGSTELTSGFYAAAADLTIGSRIECTGDVHLILYDGKTLHAPKGIAVNEDSSLTIYSQSGGTGALFIDDVDDYYAGIGGGGNSGLITINGGVITVTGGLFGAGIGGSGYNFENDGGDGNVTINGGTVTATGGFCGAGIGGGVEGAATVNIRGGVIVATGGIGASGIGGYNVKEEDSTVNLSWKGRGDSIYATRPEGTTPTCYCGTVTLEKDFIVGTEILYAGVVSDVSKLEDKTLRPPEMTEYLDADGTTKESACYEMTSGSTELTSGFYAAAADLTIGSRIECNGDVNLILCDGTTLTVPKGITVKENSSLTIYGQNGGTGELFIDNVDDYYAGIGGGGNSGLITINGGVITVTGGLFGAGIGGSGYNFENDRGDGNVTINGGTVTATGGFCGAGIGGGVEGAATVNIRGGVIVATGGIGASGIGGYNVKEEDSTVNLSWKGRGDSIYATRPEGTTPTCYCGTVMLNSYFHDGSEVFPYGKIDSSFLEDKTLAPYEVSNWADLQTLINSDIVGNTITLDKNYTADSGDTALTIPAGKEIILDLNGYTLDRNLSAAAEDGRVIVNNGNLTIKDSSTAQTGTVTGGYYNGDGGAILNNKTRTLNIEGGIFTGNTGNHGGVVYNMGTMNMTGGSMYGNTANGNGGAIWNGRQGVLNLSGGVITDNTYGEGGAVYSRQDGTLNIFGSPIVTENGNSNIYLRQAVINVTGALNADAKLAVMCEDVTDGFVFTSGLSGNGTADNFFSDNDTYSVRTNGDGEAVFKTIYTIIVEEPENGVLTAENAASGTLDICEGDEITLTPTPDEGYGIKSVTVDGDELLPENGSYSFTAQSYDVIVSAEFERSKWFAGHSLTLRGDIGINYYIYLTEEEFEKGATVDFSWNVDGTEKTHSVTLTSADRSGVYYKATVYLPVAEMSYDVTATLTIGDSETHTDAYSVKRYADYILTDEYKAIYLNDSHTEEEYEELAMLIKTMLDYGAKAQIQFERDTDNLVNEDLDYTIQKVTASMITTSPTDMTSGLSEYGLEYRGSTIVYLTKTSIRHYYKITDSELFNAVKESITFDGKAVEPVEKDGLIYFELQDIPAQKLDNQYTLHIGSNAYRYAVLDYVYDCLSAPKAPYATKQLVQATYWYNQAAKAYFD